MKYYIYSTRIGITSRVYYGGIDDGTFVWLIGGFDKGAQKPLIFDNIHEARKVLNKVIVDDIEMLRIKFWRNVIAEVPDFGSVKIDEADVLIKKGYG